MAIVSDAGVRFTDTPVSPHTVSYFISRTIIETAACSLTEDWLELEPAEVWRAILYKWCVIEKKRLHATSRSLWSLTHQLFYDYTIRHQNIQFPSCSKQFSFLADCFIAPARCPINKHLHSHDSDKWKPPLDPYEIVYPQKWLTWRYEKLGCPGIFHIHSDSSMPFLK